MKLAEDAPSPRTKILELESLTRKRGDGDVLKRVALELLEGDIAVVTGRSGSGKTTLCRVAALLDAEFVGKLRICGEDPYFRKSDQRFRLSKIGYIPQFNGLIDTLTIRENISLPLYLLGVRDEKSNIENISARLGIAHLLERFPWQVSGGEAQRTAVARAVIKDPLLIVADEPVSSLDDDSAHSVCVLLNDFVTRGRALLITSTAADSEVTSSLRVSKRYLMKDGRLSKA